MAETTFDKMLKIPVAKIGTYFKEDLTRPEGYRAIKFTQEHFDTLLSEPNPQGYETPLRYGHNNKGFGIHVRDGEKAAGHLIKYVQEDDILFGQFEAHSDEVVNEIEEDGYRYASGEFLFNVMSQKNPAKRIPIKVKTVGLTNTPFLPDLPRATVVSCSDTTPDSYFRLALVEAEEEACTDPDPVEDITEENVPSKETQVQPQAEEVKKPQAEALADKSIDDIRNEITQAFISAMGNKDSWEEPRVHSIYPDANYVIATKWESSCGDVYYRYDWTMDEENNYTFVGPQKCVMQFEAVALSDNDPLVPLNKQPMARMERMFGSFLTNLKDLLTPKAPTEVAALSDAGAVMTAPETDKIATQETPEAPKVPEEKPAEPPVEPAGNVQPVQQEGDDMPIDPETQAKLDRLTALEAENSALKAKQAEVEQQAAALSDAAFEKEVTEFQTKAASLVTPVAAQKLANVIRRTRGVEAVALSDDTDPVSLSAALLDALADAPATGVKEALSDVSGSITADLDAKPNPWAADIAKNQEIAAQFKTKW